MEDVPPSYDQSTNPSTLDIIAPYLSTSSLHAMTLVSRHYNATFMPHLWGSPASHFISMAEPTPAGSMTKASLGGSHDEIVYQALTRFKRVLRLARFSTRCLVHTLYLPSANSEIYSGPNAAWLRDILDGLPNLQSLCVGGLPFFDHNSLVAVGRGRPASSGPDTRTFALKLLLADRESNVTSVGLSQFLPYTRNLVYLDLSYTSPARDASVLSTLAALSELQVLKLRGIGLRDPEAEVLANAIGLRVRLLDLADNLLSDNAIRSLLQACFLHLPPLSNANGSGRTQAPAVPLSSYGDARRHLESWPVGMKPGPDIQSLDTLRSFDFDQDLLAQLTHPLTGRLAFEDIPHAGLTHLYITANPAVTIEGIKSLLRTGRLHVLDAGEVANETIMDKYVQNAVDRGRWHGSTKSVNGNRSGQRDHTDNRDKQRVNDTEIHFPGAEKLIPVLHGQVCTNLTYLRIDHALVTRVLDAVPVSRKSIDSNQSTTRAEATTAELMAATSNSSRVELPGSQRQPAEMPVEPAVFELDAPPAIRAELPGDMFHFKLSPPVDEVSTDQHRSASVTEFIRGDGAMAPELVADPHPTSDSVVVVDHATRGPSPETSQLINADGIPALVKNIGPPQGSPVVSDREACVAQLLARRSRLLSTKLDPSALPNLRTLVLSNIPATVNSTSNVVTALTAFISACAAEAQLASFRAKTDYSLPPGRARVHAEQEHARSLFALQTLVLEVAQTPPESNLQRTWQQTGKGPNAIKSSTGDRDSEALWSAAENDFSFFGEQGEEHDEMGIYEHEPGKYFPTVMVDDKFIIPEDETSVTSGEGPWWGGGNTVSSADNIGLESLVGSTILRSPRDLPLGRNRRRRSSSGTASQPRNTGSPHRPSVHELAGSPSTPSPRPTPKLIPKAQPRSVPLTLDVVAEVAKWRKARKAAYEEEIQHRSRVDGVTVRSALRSAESEVYVEGHWKGAIKVIRTKSQPHTLGRTKGTEGGRLERTGMVDMYGNYFERGYLYS